MSDLNMKVTVDTSEAKAEIDATESKATESSKKIEEMNKESAKQSELTFIKSVQTVQKISDIVGRSISIFGKNLSRTAKASISFATQTISTLVPILTAQEFTPWTAIQGTLGLIALGQASVQLIQLIQEEQQVTTAFEEVSLNLGDEVWWH